MNTRWTFAVWIVALASVGCATSEAAPPRQSSTVAALRCTPGQTSPCPCAGGGQGVQTCDATGVRYEACTRCPVDSLAAGTGAAPAPDAGLPKAGGGGTDVPRPSPSVAGQGGMAATGLGGAPASTPGTGGRVGLSAGQGGGNERPDPLPAERGVTCGIGLPTQCDPESEKCCKRNLEVDSCVPKSETCACDADNCTVTTVSCDGPEDCAQGQLCCATGTGRTYGEFACAARCTSAARQACHQKSDCASNLTCAISQLMASISVCTDPKTLEQ